MTRHLLLLSRGLGALPDFVHSRVRKHPGAVRVAYVPTAARAFPDPSVADHDRLALRRIGYDVRDVDIAEVVGERLEAELRDADVLYVAGGDAFFLLHHLRRSGLAARLPGLLDDGLVYVGASAGAVVMGPDIAPLTPLNDPACAPGLGSTEGLHLLGVVPVPHADGAIFGSEAIERIRARYRRDFHLEMLADDQAIIVEDDAAAVVESAVVDLESVNG
ncbi:Type 1 glutamine amidotransferase-like domain-containing protein [Microbacterium sp. NPDC078428]|uniref:Type 1 glutamine amidotransferase-like domain-containing protein n=1 Tax=Microbacterium sp. NPDC078428 TaxID=3364190 RepID=UPI0037C668DA